MELGAGAGGLGDDRLRGGPQPVGAGDVDRDVLAARSKDLVAEQRVARVRAERLAREVPLPQRREDADHHQVGTGPGGPLLGGVQARADVGLELREAVLAELLGRDVDLDVEQPELGDELGIGDRLERLDVLQGGVAVVVDEVQLDLQARHRVVGVEP